jgi:hypothetical protein
MSGVPVNCAEKAGDTLMSVPLTSVIALYSTTPLMMDEIKVPMSVAANPAAAKLLTFVTPDAVTLQRLQP